MDPLAETLRSAVVQLTNVGAHPELLHSATSCHFVFLRSMQCARPTDNETVAALRRRPDTRTCAIMLTLRRAGSGLRVVRSGCRLTYRGECSQGRRRSK